MSAITITAKSDFSTLPAKVRSSLTSASRALAALDPSDDKIATAVRRVAELNAVAPTSVRGMVALLSVANGGAIPAGKGTVERIRYVADAIVGIADYTAESVEVTIPARGKVAAKVETRPAHTSILRALYRVAQIGTAADVTRAGEVAAKSTTAQDALNAVAAIVAELNADTHKSLTTAATRAPQIGSQGSQDGAGQDGAGQDDDGSQDDGAGSQDGADRTTAQVLAGASLSSLLAEVEKRIRARGFTPDETIATAVETIAAKVAKVAAKVAGIPAE